MPPFSRREKKKILGVKWQREKEYKKKRLRLHMTKQRARAMTPRWQNDGQLSKSRIVEN